jgi:hypothetical protein
LLPEAARLANLSLNAENASKPFHLALTRYSFRARGVWRTNVEVFQEVMRRGSYDLVRGDEGYEISMALKLQPGLKKCPVVMIYDFEGLDAMSRSPLDRFGVYLWNRTWARPGVADLSLFVGEIEDLPELYRHFAACDLAIVQAGGTSTLELTALRRPFLYFPIEGHCEQELGVATRLARHRAGERLAFSETSPSSLARSVLRNFDHEVNYAPIPTDGARKAAQLIQGLL